MRVERLLGIVTHLMNRDIVSGKQLAERFEVSERTIQRDVESINMAGIPIVSIRGSAGGYQIMDTFRFGKQTGTQEDLNALKMGLEALSSAMNSKVVTETLEKLNTVVHKRTAAISCDFSVVKENEHVMTWLKVLQRSVLERKQLKMVYTNANNDTSLQKIEPISIKYMWHAWYFVGYQVEKDRYTLYKLARISDLECIGHGFIKDHATNIDYFEKVLSDDKRVVERLKIKGHLKVLVAFKEYFPSARIIASDAFTFTAEIEVVVEERYWRALMLSFEDDLEVVSPQKIREMFYLQAHKILSIYKKPDS